MHVVWINSPAVSLSPASVSAVAHTPEYAFLLPLFEYVLCTPASSAPVKRVFSQSGLLLRPHRARMSDKLLESLVLLQCSWHEWLLLTDYFNMNWLVILYVYHFHVNLNMKLTVCKGYRIQCCKNNFVDGRERVRCNWSYGLESWHLWSWSCVLRSWSWTLWSC